MGESSGALSIVGRDTGAVDFKVDLGQGLIFVTVRPPLGLETSKITVPMTILDFLDMAAHVTLGMNNAQREMLARIRAGQPPRPQ